MSIDYTTLDNAIIEIIRKSHHPTFSNILYAHSVRDAVRSVLGDPEKGYRAVDRRLQALRKKGVIRFKAFWSLVEKAA